MFTANDHAFIKALDSLVQRLLDHMEGQAPHLINAGDPGHDPALLSENNLVEKLREKYEAEHKDDMWVVAFINEGMEQGTELLRRLCAPDELLDPEVFAKQIAEEHDREIDEADGYIPNCSGDIRVEFRRDPDNGTVIWSGQSFYFKREG